MRQEERPGASASLLQFGHSTTSLAPWLEVPPPGGRRTRETMAEDPPHVRGGDRAEARARLRAGAQRSWRARRDSAPGGAPELLRRKAVGPPSSSPTGSGTSPAQALNIAAASPRPRAGRPGARLFVFVHLRAPHTRAGRRAGPGRTVCLYTVLRRAAVLPDGGRATRRAGSGGLRPARTSDRAQSAAPGTAHPGRPCDLPGDASPLGLTGPTDVSGGLASSDMGLARHTPPPRRSPPAAPGLRRDASSPEFRSPSAISQP